MKYAHGLDPLVAMCMTYCDIVRAERFPFRRLYNCINSQAGKTTSTETIRNHVIQAPLVIVPLTGLRDAPPTLNHVF